MEDSTWIGSIVGHYRVLNRLGSGGMGVVYEAEDLRLGRRVALKSLPERDEKNAEALQRFQDEAKITSRLEHPNICTLFDVGEHEGRPFLVMQLLRGQTLQERLEKGKLPIDKVLSFAVKLADALDTAHRQGVIHRDLKPGNVFLNDRGEPFILDFGLAKLRSLARVTDPSSATTKLANGLTSPGVAMGTVAYMSPEQALGADLDSRTDIFSFGAVLYEMLTGTPPFKGKTLASVFDKILNRAPRAVRSRVPDLPEGFEEIVLRTLEKKPEARYQTASELLHDLRQLHLDQQVKVHVDSTSGRKTAGKRVLKKGAVRVEISSDRLPPKTVVRKMTSLVLVAVLIMAGLLWFWPRERIFQGIVVGEFVSEVRDVSPSLLEFLVRRGLSQSGELRVLTGPEFNLAAERENRSPEVNSEWSLSEMISEMRGLETVPAVEVEGELRRSYGGLELLATISNRAYETTEQIQLLGVDALLDNGVDVIVKRAFEAYDPQSFGEFESSYRPLSQLLTKHWDAVVHFWSGRDAFSRLDRVPAEREFRSALEIDPQFALCRVGLSEVFQYWGRFEAAEVVGREAKSMANRLVEEDLLRVDAMLAQASGDTFNERLFLQKLTGRYPFRGNYVYDLAESYFHTADVDRAIELYREALILDPEFSLAYNHLAYCLAWKGEHEAARVAAEKYLELDQTANAYDSVGDIYMHQGLYDQAGTAKRSAIGIDTQSFARRNLGIFQGFVGSYLKARESLADFESFPKEDQSWFFAALAYISLRQGELEEARTACLMGLESLTGTKFDMPAGELRWLAGMTALRSGDLAGALFYLEQLENYLSDASITATRFRPAYKYYWDLRAEIELERGSEEGAKEANEELMWLQEKLSYWGTPFDYAFFIDRSGQRFDRLGNDEGAEEAYRRALHFNPHLPDANLNMGRLMERLGKSEEAHVYFEEFRQICAEADPGSPEALALAKLDRDE